MNTTTRHKSGTPTRLQARYAPYRDLAVTYEGHSEDIPVRAPDISTHGIFINTSRCFPEGTVLCVEFRLASMDAPVKVRGEVRYCLEGVGVGVEFLDLSPEAQRAIEEAMVAIHGLDSSLP